MRDPIWYGEFLGDLIGKIDDLARSACDGVAGQHTRPVVAIRDAVEWLWETSDDSPAGTDRRRLIVAIQSQTNRCDWTAAHLRFLAVIVGIMRTRGFDGIRELDIDTCYQLIDAYKLDLFRGVLSAP